MTDFFKNLNDNDFFSNKLTHIYFNSDVNDDSLDKLTDEIINANKTMNEKGKKIKPKPILIHINSLGGSVFHGLRFLSIFKLSSVPIATIIDNYSFSSATILSIKSPYRIMTKNSFCLLHHYSFNIPNFIKKFENLSNIKQIELNWSNIIDMYLENTKFKKEELEEILQHDLLLNYKYCLEKGIVDRVIDYKHPEILIKDNINKILKNEKSIKIHLLPCSNNINNLDLIIRKNNELSKQIYIIYPRYDVCKEEYLKKDYIIRNGGNKELGQQLIHNSFTNIYYIFNLINRIKAIKNKKIAIIDVPISIDELLPLLYTNKIYIYNHSHIVCNLLYFKNTNFNILLDDMLKNYITIFNNIKTILKQKTKMSLQEISDINKKYIIIHPKDAIKLGLCHEIIYS